MGVVGVALRGFGKALGKFKPKKVGDTIKSVKPNVPKTDIEKATRTLKVEGHKIKAKISKIESDVFHGTQNIKKALDKMKTPKKTKHYYPPKDF